MYKEKVQKLIDDYSKLDYYPTIIDTMNVVYNVEHNVIVPCKSYDELYDTCEKIPIGMVVIIDNLTTFSKELSKIGEVVTKLSDIAKKKKIIIIT